MKQSSFYSEFFVWQHKKNEQKEMFLHNTEMGKRPTIRH